MAQRGREWKGSVAKSSFPADVSTGESGESNLFEMLVDVDGTRRKAWLFLAADVLGRDSRDLRAAGSSQLSRGHVRPLRIRWRAGPHRYPAPGRSRPDSGRGRAPLTPRFMALASHYLLEAFFCRPGEEHDKGGVESRGKAVRQQALVPIPSGSTLAVINAALLARMDARLDTTRDAAGQTIGVRFIEEQRQFRLAPPPFAPDATTFATVSPRALVRLEGAFYSVPSRWAGLDLVVHIGATTVTIVGRETRIGIRGTLRQRSMTTALCRSWRASRRRSPGLPISCEIGDRSGDLGSAHGAHGLGRPAALRQKSSASSRRTAPPWSCPRCMPRLRPGHHCCSPSHRGDHPPASRSTRCRPRSATSTSRAVARPTTTPGCWAGSHDRHHPRPRSRRRADAALKFRVARL